MRLVELKQQFLKHLEAERGRSVKTIENYDRYLKRLLVYTKATKPAELTEEQVQAFRFHLGQQPGTKMDGQVELMKQRTQNYHLIALRAFLKYLRTRGIKALAPELVLLAKESKQSPDLISVSERKRLLSAPDNSSREGKRDQAILELLFSTGLRVSELCGLSTNDVDLAQRELFVRGKDSKKRMLVFSDPARRALQKYLRDRKDLDDALFVRYGRKMYDGGDLRLSPRAVQRLFKKYAVQVGIARKVTPQMVRHSFAKNLLGSGADLRNVQARLGHASINTTKMYTRADDKS